MTYFRMGKPVADRNGHHVTVHGRLDPGCHRQLLAHRDRHDNSLATTTSAPVGVTVNPVATGTTVVLQRGLQHLCRRERHVISTTTCTPPCRQPHRDVAGSGQSQHPHPLCDLPIGGRPGAQWCWIQSATLALYKQYYDDTLRLNALLKPWVENQATWTVRQTGVPWTAGGAAGAGTDYSTTTDALVTGSWNPGWVSFEVTPRVQQWSSGGANYGWRMAAADAGHQTKVFNSSEFTTDTTLRPKLTIVYSVP